jgi:hypothetical protein
MKRSIKSSQRSVRQLFFTVSADGATVSGLDKNQVSVVDTGTGVKTVALDEAFASADFCVQVTTGTADTLAQAVITSSSAFAVNSFDSTDGTTAKDAICYITVTGSDVSDRY